MIIKEKEKDKNNNKYKKESFNKQQISKRGYLILNPSKIFFKKKYTKKIICIFRYNKRSYIL